MFFKKKIRLMISETSTSTWNYHLRLVTKGQEKFSGGAGPALCGKPLGWDMKYPLSAYGQVASNIPQKWCSECLKIAQEQNLPGVSEINSHDKFTTA
jgi:hypothetical protein